MMGVRAQQKKKPAVRWWKRHSVNLYERSFASLSLREVAREAGIAPTSFYRHFRDVDELGLTMVDESGLMLRQLMRQGAPADSQRRQRDPHLGLHLYGIYR